MAVTPHPGVALVAPVASFVHVIDLAAEPEEDDADMAPFIADEDVECITDDDID